MWFFTAMRNLLGEAFKHFFQIVKSTVTTPIFEKKSFLSPKKHIKT